MRASKWLGSKSFDLQKCVEEFVWEIYTREKKGFEAIRSRIVGIENNKKSEVVFGDEDSGGVERNVRKLDLINRLDVLGVYGPGVAVVGIDILGPQHVAANTLDLIQDSDENYTLQQEQQQVCEIGEDDESSFGEEDI